MCDRKFVQTTFYLQKINKYISYKYMRSTYAHASDGQLSLKLLCTQLTCTMYMVKNIVSPFSGDLWWAADSRGKNTHADDMVSTIF